MRLPKNGFSLVEVLIAVTVSGLAGILIVALLVGNNGLFFQQSAKVSQGLTVNDAASQINELIKSSSFVANTNSIGSPVYLSGSDTLVLALPVFDSGGNLLTNVYDYGIITRDSQNLNLLRKIIFTDSASARKSENRVLATKLVRLTFIYFDDSGNVVSPTSATRINFTINLDEKAGYKTQQSSASGQINLRNN